MTHPQYTRLVSDIWIFYKFTGLFCSVTSAFFLCVLLIFLTPIIKGHIVHALISLTVYIKLGQLIIRGV